MRSEISTLGVKKENKIILFNEKEVRRIWDDEKEMWYFSIIDIVGILTVQSDSLKARKYWNKLSERLRNEGSEVVTECHQLKMLAKDGKMRKTEVGNTETILRLIQSVPSKKAEPFKMWLAKVGNERIEETENPELSFDRAMETYLKKGYSKQWINQRLKSIEVRKELTDEWKKRGMKQGLEYAILTDEITKAWSGKSIKDYKKIKGLKKENLRDNMSNLELVLNMLAEASTTKISEKQKPEGFEENKKIAKKGGIVAKKARLELEKQTGEDIISNKNALELGKKLDLD
ncbi:MAG: BRO family protein [Candidatus Gracilibacteria bacterium]|nr:BRO family protein [Candidatus Gracilibacteria bacterium]